LSTPFAELTGLGIQRGVPLPGEPKPVEAIELNAAGRAYLAELEEADAAKADAEQRIEHASQMLQKILGETPEATVDGRPVVTWRPYVRRSFNQRAARRFLTAEQLDACMVETVVRPFRRVTE
jgi:hypothetical protein